MKKPNLLDIFVIPFPISFDILENERRMMAFLDGLSEFSLVVFPEGALSGYSENANFVEAIDQDVLAQAMSRLKAVAIEAKIHLTFGSCVFENGYWYNAAFYFGPKGESFIYRKVNLAMNERDIFSAGDALPCFQIQHHDQIITVAFQLCREIRFPEQWSQLARKGAQVFIYLTNAVGDHKQAAVWRSHLVSRAAENQRFVLCANVAGEDQKCPSLIIDPQGYTQWESLSNAATVGADALDLTQTSTWYLDQSRQDLMT